MNKKLNKFCKFIFNSKNIENIYRNHIKNNFRGSSENALFEMCNVLSKEFYIVYFLGGNTFDTKLNEEDNDVISKYANELANDYKLKGKKF